MGAVLWKSVPDEHDYPAAASYLSLLVTGIELTDLILSIKGGGHQLLQGEGHAACVPAGPAAGGQSPRRIRPQEDQQGSEPVAAQDCRPCDLPGCAARCRPVVAADVVRRRLGLLVTPATILR